MLISCHFQDCKVLLVTSLTHVSDDITSVQTFTLYLLQYVTSELTETVISCIINTHTHTHAQLFHCETIAGRTEQELQLT